MTTTNPIVPPPELVEKIFGDALRGNSGQHDYELRLIHAAYAAGADRELEACCLWMERNFDDWDNRFSDELRTARRPKPPSLKQQALEALNSLSTPTGLKTANRFDTIRRALEQL